jgi:TIR domain
MKNPIVFISYSWDSEDHKSWVLNLANSLRLNGVDVILDRYYLSPGKNLPLFVEKSIKTSQRVIVIFTPEYKRKAEARLGGVGHEYSLINNTVLKDIANNEVVIPILRSGTTDDSIPELLQQFIYQDFRTELSFDENFESLLREIYRKPKISIPILGDAPLLPSLIETFGHKIRIKKSRITIDIKDIEGKEATYEKNLQVLVLADGLNSYNEDFGVDGFVNKIEFKPGLIKRNTTIDGRVTYDMILDKWYIRNEEFEINLFAHLLDTFTSATEHWTIISKYLCDEIFLEIKLPPKRGYKSIQGIEIDAHIRKPYGIQPVAAIGDDRQILQWTINNPKVNNSYRVIWNW